MKPIMFVAFAALGGIIAVEWLFPVKAPSTPDHGKGDAPPPAINALLQQSDRTKVFPAVAAYQSVKDRPLFFEGRRPPPEYVPTAEPDKPKPVEVRKLAPPAGTLTGIVVIGSKTFALISGAGKKQASRRLAQGDDMDGWSVESISMDKVVLRNGEERHEMPLRAFKPVAPPSGDAAKGDAASGDAQSKSGQGAVPKGVARRAPRQPLRPPQPGGDDRAQQEGDVAPEDQQPEEQEQPLDQPDAEQVEE